MIFYISIGVVLGFYIATTLIMELVQQAKADGVDNVFTKNPVLSVIINILAVAIVWPVFVPYFFSQSFKESIQSGFSKAINSED